MPNRDNYNWWLQELKLLHLGKVFERNKYNNQDRSERLLEGKKVIQVKLSTIWSIYLPENIALYVRTYQYHENKIFHFETLESSTICA